MRRDDIWNGEVSSLLDNALSSGVWISVWCVRGSRDEATDTDMRKGEKMWSQDMRGSKWGLRWGRGETFAFKMHKRKAESTGKENDRWTWRDVGKSTQRRATYWRLFSCFIFFTLKTSHLWAITIINPHTEEHFKGWAGVNYDVRPHIQRFDYFRYIIGNSLQVNKLRSAYSMSVNEFQQTYMDSDGWKFSLPRL